MKKIIIGLVGIVLCSNAYAHDFWPDDYSVPKGSDGNTLIVTHLRSTDDAYFKFTLNGIPLGESQLVYSGSTEDFPVIVPNSLLEDNKATICSLRERSSNQFQQEVCLKIEVLE